MYLFSMNWTLWAVAPGLQPGWRGSSPFSTVMEGEAPFFSKITLGSSPVFSYMAANNMPFNRPE